MGGGNDSVKLNYLLFYLLTNNKYTGGQNENCPYESLEEFHR